jgi:ubiquinone/menaquinone biosynthesis C-methylase UbiE
VEPSNGRALDRYVGKDYLSDNPTWHEDDAPWKVRHIAQILERNNIQPASLCDVGCGTGAVIELVSKQYPDAKAKGFEISPYAYGQCIKRQSENLSFSMANAFESNEHFDLCMAIDVIEHVENPFAFARSMREISKWQVLHIPLDMNALAVGRGWVLPDARDKLGHIHYFSRSSVLSLLSESGLEIVDTVYTAWAIDQSYKSLKKRLLAWPRRAAFSAFPDATVRIIGGWSLLVLARS